MELRFVPFIDFIDSKCSEDVRLSSLYIVLKDHNNDSLTRLYASSQSNCIHDTAEQEWITLNAVVLKDGRNYSSEFISTMWLTERIDSKVASELRQAIPCIKMHISMKLVDQHDGGT